MSRNYAIIIQSVLPLTTFYRSGAQRSDVYKWDVFVTSWRFHNRAWQPQRQDRLPETSGTLWIHRGALTNQRCSLATGCGIIYLSAARVQSWKKTKRHNRGFGLRLANKLFHCCTKWKIFQRPHFNPIWPHTGKALSDFQFIHNRLGCLLDTDASLCVIGNQVSHEGYG